MDLFHSIEVVINYCDPSNETDPIFIYDFTDSCNVKTNNCLSYSGVPLSQKAAGIRL